MLTSFSFDFIAGGENYLYDLDRCFYNTFQLKKVELGRLKYCTHYMYLGGMFMQSGIEEIDFSGAK
jgi:hypothetical protein